MKKLFCALLVFLCTLNLFSYDGAVSGHKKLLVQKTVWFDIIFAQENEKTARILISNADDIYEKAAAQYGLKPQCRMPLVITQKVETFNANWSSYPYNHIVMYDTAASEGIQNFEDTILSVFWHEITHSITYNMKNGFWTDVDKVLGDPIYPGSITVSRGMAEGAAVASESRWGQGRLNDDFSRQMVRQAKIEGQFPSFYDVQGASDKYPLGSFYNFNGEFYDWIQKKYGLQKFAEFWYRLVNLKSITVSAAFKKAFGVSLKTSWKEFENEFKVPVLSDKKNPVADGTAKDFFEPWKTDYSKENSAGALYENLRACDDGLIFINSKNSSLYFVDNEQLCDENKKIKPKKLFTLSSMLSADISTDKRFISVIYTDTLAATPKTRLKIYDTNKSRFYDFKDEENKLNSNIHMAAVIKNDGEYFLVFQHYSSPDYKILTYKIEASSKKGLSFSKLSEISLPYGEMVQSFSNESPESCGKSFSFLKKAGLNYSLCIYNLNLEKLFEYPVLQKNASARYLSYDKKSDSFYFSYTISDSLPRPASFNFSAKSFNFGQEDYSGGVYYPVIKNNQLYYTGSFYRQNRLLILQDKTSFAPEENLSEREEDFKDFDFIPKNPFDGELTAKPYNRLNFLKGLFIPASTVTSNSYNYGYKSSYQLPFGITYLNENPWTTGIFTFSAGYGFETESAGVSLSYQSGTFTNIFKYQIGAKTEFDSDGWKQAGGNVSLSSTIPFGRISNLLISDSALIHYGRSNASSSGGKKPDKTNYFYSYDSVSLGYSNVHKCGDGKYSNAGVSAAGVFITRYNANNPYDSEKYDFYNDVGFTGSISIPRLLPLHDHLNLTYNLPATLSLNIFVEETSSSLNINQGWKNNEFPEFNAAYANFETVLFGADIQKGNSALFFNDIRLCFHYKAGFSYFSKDNDDNWRIAEFGKYLKDLGDEVPLEQLFGLKITAGITPNYGITANYMLKGDFYFEGGVALKENKSFAFATLGLKAKLLN